MAIEERVTKSGTSYRVVWRNPITMKQEKETFNNKLDAKIHDANIKKRIKKDPKSFASVNRSQLLTFSDLTALYMKQKKMTESCFITTFQIIQVKINPNIGDMLVGEITISHMKELVKKWKAVGNKQVTCNRQMSIVKAVINWGLSEELIENNPITGYSCPRGPSVRNPPPSQREMLLIYQKSAPHIRRVIILGASIGVRIGKSELLAIRWKDVDWDARSVMVQSAKKNNNITWRDIPLGDYLYNILKIWHAEDKGINSEHIINYRGESVKCIRQGFDRTVKRAGIERKIRPYDLRHYFATQALGNGADDAATASIMGHANTIMVQKTYQHVINAKRRDAIDRVTLPDFTAAV